MNDYSRHRLQCEKDDRQQTITCLHTVPPSVQEDAAVQSDSQQRCERCVFSPNVHSSLPAGSRSHVDLASTTQHVSLRDTRSCCSSKIHRRVAPVSGATVDILARNMALKSSRHLDRLTPAVWSRVMFFFSSAVVVLRSDWILFFCETPEESRGFENVASRSILSELSL